MSKAHPTLGINADRGCTDCFFLILFFLCWGGMGYVANIAFTNGDPRRLVKGSDYMGNLCGEGTSPSVNTPTGTVPDWSNRTLLWYPITFDVQQRKMIIEDALKLAVCVSRCPSPSDLIVQPYGPPNSTSPRYVVLFESQPKFYRCVPNFLTFDCLNNTACLQQLVSSNGTFKRAATGVSMAMQGYEEVRSNWWIIIVGLGAIVVLSFVWLVILRFIVKPIVVVTCLLVLVALGGIGYLLWQQREKALAEDPPQTDNAQYMFYGAILCWALAFIYLCVLLFMRKDVMIACDIIEEATRVPTAIPSMVLLPPLTLYLVIPFLIFALVVGTYIQSAGDNVSFSVPFPTDAVTNGTFTVSNLSTTTNVSSLIQVRQYQFSNWRIYAHLFNIFMFLWSFGLLNAICFMTLAFCGVFWYWSAPGNDKEPPVGAVCSGLMRTLRYHLGTVALGSFIVAIVQIMRIILAVVEQKMKEAGQRTEAVKTIFKILHCYLAYLERVIKFINKNAYIVCALTGKNFIGSAKLALELLGGNMLCVSAITVISEYVLIFGKALITVSGMIVTWVILQATTNQDSMANTAEALTVTNATSTVVNKIGGRVTPGQVLILAIVALAGFLIASLFMNVFGVSIDTLLICFCYDKKEDGNDYYPKDLAQHVDNAYALKGGEGSLPGKGREIQGLSRPLAAGVNLSHEMQPRDRDIVAEL